MLQGKLVGTVDKDDVTKDEVLAMIIIGKQARRGDRARPRRAPRLIRPSDRARSGAGGARRHVRAGEAPLVLDAAGRRRQRRVELAVDGAASA